MKHLRIISVLWLLIILPISMAMAELNVVWVRTGVVLESKSKGELGEKIEVAIKQDISTFKTVPSQKIDEKRILLQFSWASE